MSVSKVQRSKDAAASVIYAVWGTNKAMKKGQVRAAGVSVVGPRGSNPMAWVVETRECVGRSAQRRNRTINYIQSFSPDELDPTNPKDVEKAHAAGLALAAKMAPGCDVVVATHTDTAHVHNHIVIANHDRETGLAAPKDAGNAWRVRVGNDDVMKSMGLEVLGRDPVSLSKQERLAQKAGRVIDGSNMELSALTSDTWREFMRARVEELMEDDRVVSAIDIDSGQGVESALDVMEDIALEYHLSFSRKGRGKRKSERSSFALIDDKGQQLRVPGQNGKGGSNAATAGSRLGADYTLNGLRARLHELHTQQLINEMEIEDDGAEYTTVEVGQRGTVESVGLGSQERQGVGGGTEGDADGDTRRPGQAVEDLSAATKGLGQANTVLEAFNRGNGGVRESDGPGDELDEVDGGDSHRPTGSDSASTRGVAEFSDRGRCTPNIDGRTTGDGGRTRRRAIEFERRRNREIERFRREAFESNGPETSEDDYEPGF